jgi:hypothetical protein
MLWRQVVLVFAALGTGTSVLALASPAVRPGTIESSDLNHPRNFVTIRELDRDGRTHDILNPKKQTKNANDTVTTTLEEVDAEVDQRSRILITFDRPGLAEAIKSGGLDVILSVRAEVRDNNGSRNIEVPGYSVVGDPIKRSVASLRSVSVIRGWTGEIKRAWGEAHWSLIDLAKTRKVLGSAPDSEYTPTKALPRLELAMRDPAFRKASLPAVRQKLLNIMPRVLPALTKLRDPENEAALSIIASAADRDGDAIKQEATMVAARFDALSKAQTAGNTDIEQYFDIVAIRDLLESLSDLDQDEDVIRTKLIGFMKDTDILVPLTGAKPGEDIIIELENQAGGTEQSRDMKVRVEVRRFGLVREVSDTALFIRRVGVSEGDIAGTIKAGLAEAQSSGVTVNASTPAPVNYEPAPGVMLAWTAHARRGGRFVGRGLIRALEPGFGISVVFPRFGSRISTFTPGGAGGVASATLEESTGEIHVGAGFAGSLFDNAVQCTYGWDLNVPTKRGYFGLGFSFFRVVKRVGDLVSTTK